MYTGSTWEYDALRQKIRCVFDNVGSPWATDDRHSGPSSVEMFRFLAENALLGIHVSRDYGGAGSDMVSRIITVEEVARWCSATSFIIVTQVLASLPLLVAGTELQKKTYLYRLASGQCAGACVVSGLNKGSDLSDLSDMTVTARKVSGGYILNGSARYNAGGAAADIITVPARMKQGDHSRAITMFLVESGDQGMIPAGTADASGMVTDHRELVLEELFLPEARRIGDEGTGDTIFMQMLTRMNTVVAAQSLGICQGILEGMITEIRAQKRCGSTFLTLEGAQWLLAETALRVETARSLLYRVALLIDGDQSCTNVEGISSMAKWHASDVAAKVLSDAGHISGIFDSRQGRYPERIMQDARIARISEGSNLIQRALVACRVLQ